MISVMMLTYNGIGKVMRCLQTVAPSVMKEQAEWIILDNGSKDGTGHWLMRVADKQPELGIKLILEESNLGVAGGRQKMLEIAQGDTLVFLDSDVIFEDALCLARLSATLAYGGHGGGTPEVGLTGPGGNFVLPHWAWYDPAPADYSGPVDTVSGFCQAFSRRVLETGIALDQEFNPYWHEDTDFCMQVKQKGFTIWQTGRTGIRHNYSGSGDDGSGRAKQKYLASKWQGKGLVRMEQVP